MFNHACRNQSTKRTTRGPSHLMQIGCFIFWYHILLLALYKYMPVIKKIINLLTHYLFPSDYYRYSKDQLSTIKISFSFFSQLPPRRMLVWKDPSITSLCKRIYLQFQLSNMVHSYIVIYKLSCY